MIKHSFNDTNKENKLINNTYSINTNYIFIIASTSLKLISMNSMVNSSSSSKKNKVSTIRIK